MPDPIRALIVDDSAFARKVVREMLQSPLIDVVGAARDGGEALELVERLKPDVVVCDLTMPNLDGVAFVREQMSRQPLPILLLTASPEDADLVLEALTAGAVDMVRKPSALATRELLTIRMELVRKVTEVSGVSRHSLTFSAGPVPAGPLRSPPQALKADIVVLGISTGGPQALRRLVPQLPADFAVPIVIVLHMPVGYTALFAEKLNEISAIEVREAKAGEMLAPGTVLIAPAGRHVSFQRSPGGRAAVSLSVHPIDRPHRPSVDVLFQSAAENFGARVLGVVMTGMGDDGKEGAAWIKAQGGTVLTETESSCVIYGMPRSVVEANLSDAAIPLDEMAREITLRI